MSTERILFKPISGHYSHFISPENTKKPRVFWCFQGMGEVGGEGGGIKMGTMAGNGGYKMGTMARNGLNASPKQTS